MTEADSAPLRAAGFDDRAIHDACAIVSYFAFVSRIANGLGSNWSDLRSGVRYQDAAGSQPLSEDGIWQALKRQSQLVWKRRPELEPFGEALQEAVFAVAPAAPFSRRVSHEGLSRGIARSLLSEIRSPSLMRLHSGFRDEECGALGGESAITQRAWKAFATSRAR